VGQGLATAMVMGCRVRVAVMVIGCQGWVMVTARSRPALEMVRGLLLLAAVVMVMVMSRLVQEMVRGYLLVVVRSVVVRSVVVMGL
jgi:hypothetical protein